MRNGFTWVAAGIVVLIFIKDGTAGSIIGGIANTAKAGANGLKPLTTVA